MLLTCWWEGDTSEGSRGGEEGGSGTHLLLAFFSNLTIYHASSLVSGRSTVPIPNRDTSSASIWALNTIFPYQVYYMEKPCC